MTTSQLQDEPIDLDGQDKYAEYHLVYFNGSKGKYVAPLYGKEFDPVLLDDLEKLFNLVHSMKE
jgi:hypothetical protein